MIARDQTQSSSIRPRDYAQTYLHRHGLQNAYSQPSIVSLSYAALHRSSAMHWRDVVGFILGYLVVPALCVGAAALVIHVILLIVNYRSQRALRADSWIPS